MNNGVKDKRQSVEKKCNGSSVAMEVDAAKMVFGRSVAIRTLYYQTSLCDAKTIMTLNKMHIYSQHVKKEDCINHVAKFPTDTLYHQLYGTLNADKKSSEFVKRVGRDTHWYRLI